MSFRKKLIVLLICLSIAPILALRAFGIHNVRLFAEEVVRQVHLNHQKSSEMHFSPIPHMGAGLVLVVPRQEEADLAGLLETIRERTRRVEIVTAVFLAVLVLAATMAALAFSRIVTIPLEKLTRAARKLAGGDMQARVAIDSRDEIGELGRVFNRIGPELSHAYAMRRSVELASKIQEHLLPHPPRVDGCGGSLSGGQRPLR